MSQQETTNTASTKKPRRWFSFSLFNLMFMSAFLVTVISHVFTSRELNTSKKALRQLRNDVGYLDVQDPNLLHVKAISMLEPNTWRWRIFIPEGRRFYLKTATQRIPYDGLPQKSAWSCWISPGETLIDIAVFKHRSGQWERIIKTSSGSATAPMQQGHAMTANTRSVHVMQAGQIETESVAPGKSMVLLRVMAESIDKTGKLIGPGIKSKKPLDGLMIWIDGKP